MMMAHNAPGRVLLRYLKVSGEVLFLDRVVGPASLLSRETSLCSGTKVGGGDVGVD